MDLTVDIPIPNTVDDLEALEGAFHLIGQWCAFRMLKIRSEAGPRNQESKNKEITYSQLMEEWRDSMPQWAKDLVDQL